MTYQVWFTSNEIPPFSDEDKDTYRRLVENQVFPIGNIVDGRHLLRCMASDFPTIQAFLVSCGKEPVMCGARDIEGNWIIESTQDGSVLNVGFCYNPEEFEKHMQDITTQDKDGNPITTSPTDNTTRGYLAFRELKLDGL